MRLLLDRTSQSNYNQTGRFNVVDEEAAFVSYPKGTIVLKSSEVERVEQILAQNVARLQASLQRASKTHSGPEEGSDAWLFLNALIDNERATLDARFEQSGRALAEHGGKLEARISGLQSYCDALA